MRFGLSDVNFDHGVEWEVKLPEGQAPQGLLDGQYLSLRRILVECFYQGGGIRSQTSKSSVFQIRIGE